MYQIEQLDQWCFNLIRSEKYPLSRNGAKRDPHTFQFMKPEAEATLRDNPRFRLSGNDLYSFFHLQVYPSFFLKKLYFSRNVGSQHNAQYMTIILQQCTRMVQQEKKKGTTMR